MTLEQAVELQNVCKKIGISTSKITQWPNKLSYSITVYLSDAVPTRLAKFLQWIRWNLEVVRVDTYEVNAFSKDGMESVTLLNTVSAETLAMFGLDFWHYRPDISTRNLNVEPDALKHTELICWSDPIQVELLLDGKKYTRESKISDEVAFAAISWLWSIQILLNMMYDTDCRYLGSYITAVVEMYKNYSYTLLQNKRLQKTCGYSQSEREVYILNARLVRSVSKYLVPIQAKLLAVVKSLTKTKESWINATMVVSSIAQKQPQDTFKANWCIASMLIDALKTYLGHYLFGIIILPRISGGYDFPEDFLYSHEISILSGTMRALDKRVIRLIEDLLDSGEYYEEA